MLRTVAQTFTMAFLVVAWYGGIDIETALFAIPIRDQLLPIQQGVRAVGVVVNISAFQAGVTGSIPVPLILFSII